jgi:hypothetical protein
MTAASMSELDETTRKYAIDELKIVQDILLKQEAYALGVLRQTLIVLAGLVFAFLSEKTAMSSRAFWVVSISVCVGSIVVQSSYRAAFHRALDRSHLLQQYLGGRLDVAKRNTFQPFAIYESMHDSKVWWEFCGMFKREFAEFNLRFIMPNVLLLVVAFSVPFLRLEERVVVGRASVSELNKDGVLAPGVRGK